MNDFTYSLPEVWITFSYSRTVIKGFKSACKLKEGFVFRMNSTGIHIDNRLGLDILLSEANVNSFFFGPLSVTALRVIYSLTSPGSSPAASLRYDNCAAYGGLCRRSLTRLVVALVLSRLDFCNGVLAGRPASQLSRLQSVLHVRRHDHVRPLLQLLH